MRLPDAQFALMEFERPVTCSRCCIVIGSRLDADIHVNACRLAFHGYLLEPLSDPNYSATVLPRLRVIKERRKEAVVERQVYRQFKFHQMGVANEYILAYQCTVG